MTEHTPGPWVQFAIDGKCDAIMPAGRDGDICTFRQAPNDADARLITAAPDLVKALEFIAGDTIDFSDVAKGFFQMRDAARDALARAQENADG